MVSWDAEDDEEFAVDSEDFFSDDAIASEFGSDADDPFFASATFLTADDPMPRPDHVRVVAILDAIPGSGSRDEDGDRGNRRSLEGEHDRSGYTIVGSAPEQDRSQRPDERAEGDALAELLEDPIHALPAEKLGSRRPSSTCTSVMFECG